MYSVLEKVNLALQEAIQALEGPLKQQRLHELLNADALPIKTSWELAAKTVDLADHVVRLLRPPAEQLAESYLGYLDTKCLVAAVERNIPDALADAPLSIPDLAAKTNLDPLRLAQILRVLSSNGIFDYDSASQTYANSPSSALLAKDHPSQWHRWVDLYGNNFYDAAAGIPRAILANESRTAAQIALNTEKPFFEYLADQNLLDKFHGALGAGALAQAPGIAADYPWSQLADATILDIGGGAGDFIASLLRSHPTLHGAVLELPSVVSLLRARLDPALDGSISDIRTRLVALHEGDFLASVPSYEVYTIKWCLHNWLDGDVVRILANVRRAIRVTPRARLVVVEAVLTEGRGSRVWRYGDMVMMMTANGQERTEGQWRALADRAGWRVGGVWRLRNAWAAAIELRPSSPLRE